MAFERSERRIRRLLRDRDKQAARSLRIEQQRAKFLRNIAREADATFAKVAIVLHSAGEKMAARRFDRSGKIGDLFVIDFHGDAAANCHFARVPEKAKPGDVGDSVYRPLVL